jgi:hypothetical protein
VEVDTAAVSGRFGPIDWAVGTRPVPGEVASGDKAIAVELDGLAAVFGVIDGLGHGPGAAAAADRAAEVITGSVAQQPLDEVIGACHRELASTRGAAMTLAKIDFRTDTLTWTGVGNVTAALLWRAPSGLPSTSFVRLVNGIVGYRLPRMPVPETVEMRPGHLLVMASDGITEDHLDGLDFAATSGAIANRILGEHTRVTDDALVLVARHRGSP